MLRAATLRLADRVLGRRRAEAAVGVRHRGAVAGRVDAVEAGDGKMIVDGDAAALVELDVHRRAGSGGRRLRRSRPPCGSAIRSPVESSTALGVDLLRAASRAGCRCRGRGARGRA